ncbi:MAG: hypothetical protein QXK39_00045 [Nitrososphaerota archaeon]
MSKPTARRLVRYIIKGVGAALTATTIYIAYLYYTLAPTAYPIISALFIMVIAFMVVGSLLALLF